ncbi:TPA: hypothetical protein ACS7ZY_000503 [Providencia alcalifaciens]
MGSDNAFIIITHSSILTSIAEFKYVRHGTIIDDALEFVYQQGLGKPSGYWMVDFTPIDNLRYRSGFGYSCDINKTDAPDEGKVILGVNGEASRLYTVLADNSKCATDISRVWI